MPKPKVAPVPKKPTPKPSAQPIAKPSAPALPVQSENAHEREWTKLGQAVALANLAEKMGVNVSDVEGMHDAMTEAGLVPLLPGVGAHAHRIYRDRVDAMLYRCNRPAAQPAPQLTKPEAEAVVAEAHPTPKPSASPSSEAARTDDRPPAKRSKLFDTAATKVVMWMGKQGWTEAEAKKALDHYGIEFQTAGTVKLFLKAGKNGQRGDPAKLTAAQAKELTQAKDAK